MPSIKRETRIAPTNGDGKQRAYALHKQHAVVHTASIDVKIMRLDKRQVTMSVFRQLDEELIFAADGSLRGTPWGRVSYLWKDNREGTAFHVVWQDGDRIKRSPVPKDWIAKMWNEWLYGGYTPEPPYPDSGPKWSDVVRECGWRIDTINEVLTSETSETSEVISARKVGIHVYDKELDSQLRQVGWVKRKDDYKIVPLILEDYYYDTLFWDDLRDDTRDELYASLTNALPILEQARERATRAHEALEKRQQQWEKDYEEAGRKFWQRVEEMKRLDQLFIAV